MRLVKKFSFAVAILLLIAVAAAAEQTYPQLDISGFKKWEHKKVEVDPSRNYFTGLSQLGGFYPTFTGGPWQERLQLRILGQLSENLSVTYDLEQQPETPDKFDVKVKYYNNELTFGDFNANFSGNEFVSASKFLNGVMFTAKDNWYDITTVPSAKLKSQTQNLTSQKGNNARGPYNLGHGGIVEDSEQIQLNGNYLKRNVDYIIDYFEGKITFNRILSQTDEFKYSYEYTNLLDLFFPALSKRDFFGFQSRFTIDPDKFGKPAPKEEPVINAARELFPGAGTFEPDVQEAEASGRYQLKNYPLLKFSEVLTFMGTLLKKNEDYLIRYDTGEIKLLTRFLPSSEEALVVEYQYYQTSTEAEVIPGIGSRGPYRARHPGMVAESERIEVDGKPFVRNLDYTINYDTGEILFGVVIGPTSQIEISYRYNVVALPPAVPSMISKELKIGTTYLKETARKGAGAPTTTNIETVRGQDLLANNFIFNLRNRPILPTTEASFIVRLKHGTEESRELTWEADYVIPTTYIDPLTGYVRVTPEVKLAYITDRNDLTNGYGTGTVYFFNHSIVASDEITVTYSYKKSIVGKFSGAGNGSKGPYYLRNTREIVPGTETVQVWDQGSTVITTYTRNGSFEADAGDTGYSINYTTDNPSIAFNLELASTKNFQVIYQYVPPSGSAGGDVSQVAYGFDGSFKIGDVFNIDSSFARSETDQVFVAESTSESFTGNGTKNYSLRSTADIIEGSEKIYVNQRLLNKDIDYFIGYTKPGQFNFYYITPTTQDAISVEYNFQSLSGIEVGKKVKGDTAFRLGAKTKIFGDVLTLSGNTKKIGFDFSPLGGTAIGLGSEYNELNASFKPAYQSFYANYSYKVNNNPQGPSRKLFTRGYDNSVSTGFNPGGVAKIDMGYRNFLTLDDPATPEALHNNDNLQESYSTSIVPAAITRGPLSINLKGDLRKTSSISDYIDKKNRSTSNTDYYHVGTDIKFTERISAGYDWQYNEPITRGSLETETAHSLAADRSYNFSVDLTMGFLKKWTARVSLLNHEDIRRIPTPETTTSTKNETYHMDITPFTILTGSLDHNLQERTSYVVGGENPRSSRTTGTTRLTPISWFSFGFNASESETIPETGSSNKTSARSLGYDADYTPLSFNLLKLASRFAASDSRQTAPSGAGSVITKTNTFSQNYTLNLYPLPILPLSFGYAREDYKNSNDSMTSPVTTETQNLTASVGLTFTPVPVFTLSGDYTEKTTKDLIRSTSPVKKTLNAKAAYQVLSWGTLALDWQSEKNQGEVQGGVLTALSYEKETLNRSLNITIPIDNPVLSNFVLSISWKSVNYKNLAKPDKSDDFYAQLLSFEGTMNF